MTAVHSRLGEPLFVIILRHSRANAMLRDWAGQNASSPSQVQENRLHLFDHHALSSFIITWQGGWDHLVIWDAWNKRHIDIQNI